MFYFLININITKIRTIRPYSTSYLIKIWIDLGIFCGYKRKKWN